VTEFLELLYEVSRSFAQVIELEHLVPLVIRKTKELLGAEGGAVLLLDEDARELFFPFTAEASPEVDQRLAGIRVPVASGIAGWVVRHGVSELIADATQDERWYPEVDQQTGMRTRSLLTAPLRTQRGIIGVIQLRSSSVGAFSNEGLQLLDALAQGIAVAIDNARLYQKVKESEVRLRDRVAILQREVARSSRFAEIVGGSEAMQQVLRLVESAITAPVAVLLQGETGTGKELIARAIHFNGPRQSEPFVAVNCGALGESLLESELFGHRRGAFTGAVEDRKGLFEVANGGTVFLDEVGEMTPAMQVRLLRVLQSGEILPVGERFPRFVDVRVISATNRDLADDLEQGRFRQDLYYRLSTFPITIPPLRERREDIPLLAAHFLERISKRFDKTIAGLSTAALEALAHYSWPGNVRQLQNELERAVVLTPSGELIDSPVLSPFLATPAVEPSPPQVAEPQPEPQAADDDSGDGESLQRARAAFEARHIATVLHRHGGNVSLAARKLGLSRSMLYNKIREYKIGS